MSGSTLRFLSGVPLVVMAAALLVLGVQRVAPPPAAAAPRFDFGAALMDEGRGEDALAWYRGVARTGAPRDLRALAMAADRIGDTRTRADALGQLVRNGAATLDEHIEAAQLLASAGALQGALTMLYNAERRFAGALDERFLGFYAALARDAARKDIALPLARRMWTRTSSDRVLEILVSLSGP
ncbi:MAG: hypothetical protein QM698_04800 [Micropepsaceae bacterium]